jgi:hypothetical protein
MNRLQVWLRPLGSAHRVKVAGSDNAKWLCCRLQEQDVECMQPEKTEGTAFYMVVTTVPSPIVHSRLPEIVSGMPEVQLMLESA